MSDLEILRRLAAGAAPSEEEVERAREARDYGEAAPSSLEAIRPAHPVPELSDEQVRALVSDEARLKVIEFEVTSEQVYRRKYERPIAPGGASGITVGIGYDVGWNTKEAVRRDFAGLIPAEDIETLTRACGLRGDQARRRLSEFRAICVPWEAAIEVYRRATVPRFGRDVLRTFPNAVDLKGHCFGALLSLVYNRGTDLEGERRKEMRAIRDLTAERRWSEVSAQFRRMKRIWEGQHGLEGLLLRREAEALLFERGLELMETPVAFAGHRDTALESLAAPDLAAIEGDGYSYRELDSAEALERGDPAWNKVVWPPREQAPDYSHIPDRGLAGSAFQLGPRELELLIEANGFQPSREHGRIVFALRGAQLIQALDRHAVMERQENRDALILRECEPDHKSFRCVVGVYDTQRGRMHGYQASTVPNPKAVASYVAGGSPSNMMLTGCYRFQVGWHQESRAESKIPGCLIEYGRRKAVLRTNNNHAYDLTDAVDDTTPGDNVHPGKSEGPFPFSSWGCLVLSGSVNPVKGGRREDVEHTGEWARFRKMLGLPDRGTGGHGREHSVILLTGLDAAIAADALNRSVAPAEDVMRRQLYRLRQGSQGRRVGLLRRGLGMPAGERFDSAVAAALAKKQRAATGKIDALYSPASDAAFGFGVFSTPGPMALLEGRSTAEAGPPDTRLQRDSLAFELGALFEASRGGRGLGEEAQLESLGSAVVELGQKALVATGNALIEQAELMLCGYVCRGDGLRSQIDREDIRQRIDDAAKAGLGHLKHVLVVLLKQASFSFAPEATLEWLVGFVLDEIVLPYTGGAGDAVVRRIDGGIGWLCAEWRRRIEVKYGVAIQAPPPEPEEGPPPELPSPSAAQPSAQAAAQAAAQARSQASRLLARIEQEAEQLNVPGVRSYIRELRDHLHAGAGALSAAEERKFLDILCNSRFMDQLAGPAGGDPYALIAEIEQALASKPLDRAMVEGRVRALRDLLGDARLKLDSERVEKLLKTLRSHRFSDQVTALADRVLTRDHDATLLGRVSPHYALALIDSQRIVAGIEILNAALEQGRLTPESTAEVYGNIGRAHKQIYVNHVRSPSDALALQATMGPQLLRAIDCYGRIYDPSQPAKAYWHGINLVALAKRAMADGVATPRRQSPDDLARGLIAALEPAATGTDDHFLVATLGEAYLAIGDVDNAAKSYAEFAKHKNADAFALNSAIRQLEEVWRLEAGRAGADGILIGLKAALAQAEGGHITLSASERQAIAGTGSAAYQERFESLTPDGRFVSFEYLKRIVSAGMAVAAIKQKSGASAGHTIGTGFLIDGASLGLDGGRSYLLTNAHVLWDPDIGPGQENGALAPGAARIVFEGAGGGNRDFACGKVLWQSQSSLHDATLLALDRVVDRIDPLELASSGARLVSDDGTGKRGTRLAVLGHPKGGPLQIGLSGSLEEINARLVDKGPKGNSTDPEYLHYTVPTEPGNSGSPVIETESWTVVGLHHAGFHEARGRDRLAGKAGTNQANEGIWIESIRAAVRGKTGRKARRGWFDRT